MSHKHRHNKHKSSKKAKYPDASTVDAFLVSVRRRARKRGTRYYKKHRSHADKTLNEQLIRYGISGTRVETYWKLKGTCILIGAEKF